MFKTLLCLGLLASAFTFSPFSDLREIKMDVAVFFALALGMVEIFQHGFKPLRNRWLLILLAYLPFSIFMSPSPTIELLGIQVGKFWAYQPMAQLLAFFLMFMAVQSHDFEDDDILLIFKTISWAGYAMAFYIILQRFGMDQFFVRSVHDDQGPTASYAGFLANPTLSAPFIAMTVPFMVYIRKWWMLPVAFMGLYFPDSQMAWAGLIVGGLFLFATKGRIRLVVVSVMTALVLLGAFSLRDNSKIRSLVDDHERFYQWKLIAKDIAGQKSNDVNVRYPLTGLGIGSFKYVYHINHPGQDGKPNKFHQAHNDYLEWAYNTGLAGICLLLASIFWMFRQNLCIYTIWSIGENPRRMTIMAGFVIASVVAIGTFIFQIGTVAFYVTLFAGLLHNHNLKRTLT